MLSASPIHAESARYAASLVFIPGPWAGPEVWRPAATYLAHRGWEGSLLDVRAVPGGLAARAVAVADHAAKLPSPPVLLGHDAGALVALAAAARGPAAAVVGVAPILPGSASARARVSTWSLPRLILRGRRVQPPSPETLALDELPEAARRAVMRDLQPEDGSAVLDVARGRIRPAPAGALPALIVSGRQDRLLPPTEATALAAAIGADHRLLDVGGHWLLAGSAWQACVGVLHRWLVLRLGETLLELYPEAMAERDAEDPE